LKLYLKRRSNILLFYFAKLYTHAARVPPSSTAASSRGRVGYQAQSARALDTRIAQPALRTLRLIIAFNVFDFAFIPHPPPSARKLVAHKERGTPLLLKSLRLHALALAAVLPLAAQQPAKPVAPVTRASLVGMYNGGQMEVGAQMELLANGHFRYELAYGAMDEEAQGTWEFKDGAVFLTSVPAVKQPQYVVISDVPDSRGGLWVKVSNGPVFEVAHQRLYLFYDSNFSATAHPDMVEVGDDGKVPLPHGKMPKFIIPEIPIFPILNKPIPVTGDGGHLITLRFDKNDIGKGDFRALRLPIEDGVLVMTRPDLELELHFRRQAH
jgi:hypothetical protein